MISLVKSKKGIDKNELRIAGQKAADEFQMEFVQAYKPMNYPYYATFEDGEVWGNYVRFKCKECGEVSIQVVFDSGQLIQCPNCNEIYEVTEEDFDGSK